MNDSTHKTSRSPASTFVHKIRAHKLVLFGIAWLAVIGLLGWSIHVNDTQSKPRFAREPAWQQDFTTQQDGLPDPAFWTYDRNPETPSFNNEAQAYTDRSSNVRIENGKLVIEARKEQYTYPNTDKTYGYTSGKLMLKPRSQELGQNDKAFAYGKLIARLRMPTGQGTWPAFWLLSDSQPHTAKLKPSNDDWQRKGFYKHDGEIDIVEGYGQTNAPSRLEATVHTFNGPDRGKSYRAPLRDGNTGFHDYGAELTPTYIRFTIDGAPFATYTKRSDNPDDWPFTNNNKMYAILNLAMGGEGGGTILGDGPWQLHVESVRFYLYQQ